jgi:hypothetical protein
MYVEQQQAQAQGGRRRGTAVFVAFANFAFACTYWMAVDAVGPTLREIFGLVFGTDDCITVSI